MVDEKRVMHIIIFFKRLVIHAPSKVVLLIRKSPDHVSAIWR